MGLTLAEQVRAFKRREVIDAIVATGGNRAQAARNLGLEVNTIFKLITRLGIRPDEIPAGIPGGQRKVTQ